MIRLIVFFSSRFFLLVSFFSVFLFPSQYCWGVGAFFFFFSFFPCRCPRRLMPVSRLLSFPRELSISFFSCCSRGFRTLIFVFFMPLQGVFFFVTFFSTDFSFRLISDICLHNVHGYLLYIEIQIQSQIIHSLDHHGKRYLPPQPEARPHCSSHRRRYSSQLRISRLRTSIAPPPTSLAVSKCTPLSC